MKNLAHTLFPQSPSPHHKRIHAETHATDSYQNLLFSLVLYRHEIGAYPLRLTIISHAFKENRILNYHCKAIKWPLSRTTFVGIDPPEEVTSRAELDAGEAKAVDAWREDLYGVGDVLGMKRRKRGWGAREVLHVEYGQSADDSVFAYGDAWAEKGLGQGIHDLLRYDGGGDGKTLLPGSLPWEEESGVVGDSGDDASAPWGNNVNIVGEHR